MNTSPDVIIAGAGIIGCAAARALSDAGFSVALIDPGRPGHEASSAAAGLLTPQYEAEGPGPFFDLCNRARALYPDFVESLITETGLDVELRREGMLVVALDAEDDAALESMLDWQQKADLRVERIAAGSLQEMEPLAAPAARWGIFLPDDIQVDNVKLFSALIRSLQHRRIEWHHDDAVEELKTSGGGVAGVRLTSGVRLSSDRVVIAAGAWSGRVRGLPRSLPIKPLRGQMVELDVPGAGPQRCLASRRAYAVPRIDGRLLVGSTVEDVGFRRGVSAGGVHEILRNLLELAPGLGSARLTRTWSGLRPGTPDGLPVLGEDREMRGLIYATGHHRNGILLAPLTAAIVTALATDSPPGLSLAPYASDRFGELDFGGRAN